MKIENSCAVFLIWSGACARVAVDYVNEVNNNNEFSKLRSIS